MTLIDLFLICTCLASVFAIPEQWFDKAEAMFEKLFAKKQTGRVFDLEKICKDLEKTKSKNP